MQPELRALKSNGFVDDSYAYVACMAVDDDWRRQGVASDLLAHAEKMAGRWMLTWVLLHVHVDNVAGELGPALSKKCKGLGMSF